MTATVFMLPMVRLFASGNYRGRPWSGDIVDRTAATTKKLAKQHVAPGVAKPIPQGGIGHDENEASLEWLERTDLPASGVVDPASVQSIPDPEHPGHKIMVGNLVNVPAETAEKIRNGEYLTGSAEIYEDFTDDFGRSHGPALRRFVILGGTPPRVKRLGRLPMPVAMAAPMQFAEGARFAEAGAFVSFADLQPMDQEPLKREDMVAAIQEAMPNLSTALLDTLSDDQVKEILAAVPKPPEPAPTGVAPMADPMLDPAPVDAAPPAGPSREEMIAALVAAGQDQAMLEAMPDEELKALYDQVTAAPAVMPEASPVAMMSETDRNALPDAMQKWLAFSEQEHKRQVAQAKRQAAREKEIKKKKVNAFCDTLVRDGKLFPAQRGDYYDQLIRLDDFYAVHKFAENGRSETLTALDRKMRELDKRPAILRFGEKIPGKSIGAQSTAEVEVDLVRSFAQTLSDNALKSCGYKSAEQFVEKFSEACKKKPDLTAKQYLGNGAVR